MTPRKVVLRPSAQADLTDISHYIAARSGYPTRAMEYIRRRRAYCETLAAFPERGRRRDDLRRDLWMIGFERRAVIASYKILDTGDVEIGRIFYGGRGYETIMRDDDT